jgi:hypothetical protein
MEARGFEVDLFPSQIADFRCPQTVPEGQKHHESVAVTIAIVAGRFDQPLDLVDGQVLPCPNISIFWSPRRDCSAWSRQPLKIRRRGLAMRNPPLACLTVQYIGIL